jgi:hypothetical protein
MFCLLVCTDGVVPSNANLEGKECPMSRPKTVTIQEIVATPMPELRFRHFASLKVGGRDQYTPLKLAQLKLLVSDSDIVDVALDHDEKAVASCLRWILRGLPIEKAIRKVRTDLEIAEQARLSSLTQTLSSRIESDDHYNPEVPS